MTIFKILAVACLIIYIIYWLIIQHINKKYEGAVEIPIAEHWYNIMPGDTITIGKNGDTYDVLKVKTDTIIVKKNKEKP